MESNTTPSKLQWLARRSLVALARPKIDRQETVLEEYTVGWSSMAGHLDRCATLEDCCGSRASRTVPITAP
jgi:hypothetical protein